MPSSNYTISGAKSVTPPGLHGSSNFAVRAMQSFAALSVVAGATGAVMLPFGILLLHQGDFAGDLRVHFLDEPLLYISASALWMFISSLCGTALGITLMVGAIGALKMRSWARPVLIIWAVASVVVLCGGAWFEARWLLPPWRDSFADVRGVIDSLTNIGGWAAGGALGVTLLGLLFHPDVRIAFAAPKGARG